MAGVDNLTPWRPGQSGNPEGTTRARRQKALLKDFIAEGMGAEIPEDLAERATALLLRDNPKLDPEKAAEHGRKLAERFQGLKVGQAIAGDVLTRALAGSNDDLRLIVAMEPNELKMSGQLETSPHSAEFAPTSDDDALLESARDAGQVH